MYIYVGIDTEKEEKYIILDKNLNNDFSDDTIYTFSFKDLNTNIKDIKSFEVQIDLFNDLFYPKGYKIDLSIVPFYFSKILNDKLKLSEEEIIKINIYVHNFALSQLTINHETLLFRLFNANLGLVESKNINKQTILNLSEKIGDSIYNNIYKKVGDTVNIIGRKLYLKESINNTLKIEDLGAQLDSSRIGSFIPCHLFVRELNDSNYVDFNKLIEDKYVIVDFWGSWCKPCINSIPKLKELFDVVKDREDVIMLGIALEKSKDIVTLQNIIKKNDIEWYNYWIDTNFAKFSTSIMTRLSITQYPTYLIIDKDKRIIYKTNTQYEDLKNSFFNLINK